jgi:hypothetical protein
MADPEGYHGLYGLSQAQGCMRKSDGSLRLPVRSMHLAPPRPVLQGISEGDEGCHGRCLVCPRICSADVDGSCGKMCFPSSARRA